MIKARLSNGDLILGISEENVKRLKEDQPILVRHSEVGDTNGDIIIYYGQTDWENAERLQKLLGEPEIAHPVTDPHA